MLFRSDIAPQISLDSQFVAIQKNLDIVSRIEGGAKNICLFIEGPLLPPAKYGYWILLDESNLASNDVVSYINNTLRRRPVFVVEMLETIPFSERCVVFQCANPGDDHEKKYRDGSHAYNFYG